MKITQHVSKIKTIHQGDSDFVIIDGITATPRAGFEISLRCPREYRMIIQQCIDTGWLKPVAHVVDHELTWDRLNQ